MLQYKVPQNIKMPDQIIGPLTLEQFLYLLFSAAGVYMVYLQFGAGNLFYALSIPLVLLALAFAFVPVNEQPFSKFVLNLVLFLFGPKILTWQPLPPPVFEVGSQAAKTDKNKEKEAIKHPEEIKSQLQQLSLILDTQIEPQKDVRSTMSDIAQEDTAKQTMLAKQKTTAPAVPIANSVPQAISAEVQPASGNVGSFIKNIFAKKPTEPQAPQEIMAKENQSKKEAIEEILRQQR